MNQTSNPILGVFRAPYSFGYRVSSGTMTVEGTALRTICLGLLTALSYAINWQLFESGDENLGLGPAIGGSIGAFILGVIISFWASSAPSLSPLYALCEGCLLSAVSYGFESHFPGIAVRALGLTIFTVLSIAALYYTRVLQVNDRFRSIVFGATLGIALFYMFGAIFSIFGIHLPAIGLGGGLLGIVINLVVVGVAALNLALDFDMIERGSGTMPQYMEWYAAFGLLVTIIWMYLEMLRLLAQVAQTER